MGTTPSGLPWPDGNAFVRDGDDAIRELAEAIEPRLVRAKASGTTPVPVTNDTSRVVAVTLPGGRFPTTPNRGFCNITNTDAAGSYWMARVTGKTTGSFQLFVFRVSGAANSPTLSVEWTVELFD